MRLHAALLAMITAPAVAHPYDPLAGLKPSGAPVDCIQTRLYGETNFIGTSTIVYSDGLHRAYVNTLPAECPSLSRIDLAITTTTPQDSLCRGDIVTLFDPVSHIVYGSCGLGSFTPYAR